MDIDYKYCSLGIKHQSIYSCVILEEKFKDTKGVVRSRKQKKDKKHKKKKRQKDKQ